MEQNPNEALKFIVGDFSGIISHAIMASDNPATDPEDLHNRSGRELLVIWERVKGTVAFCWKASCAVVLKSWEHELEVNDKVSRNKLSKFVGKYAYGVYPAPAITCCMNGRMIHCEGKVTGIGMDGMGHVGVVIDNQVFHLAEIKCPSLHWEGMAYKERTAP